MDFFVDCCQLSVCWRWGTCQVVMSPWRWMYRRFRAAGYNGKARRSVTVLHQAAAGSISGVAPASDKRESWRGREQEREGEWWVSDRKEKLGRKRVGRDIVKELVRWDAETHLTRGVFSFFLLVSHLGSQLPPGSNDYRAAEQAAALPAQRHERSRTQSGRQSGHPRQWSERRAPAPALWGHRQRGHSQQAVRWVGSLLLFVPSPS